MSSPASKMKYGTVLKVDGALFGITAESMEDLEKLFALQSMPFDPAKVSRIQLQQIADGDTESRFSKEFNALIHAKPLITPAMAIAMDLAKPDGLVRYPGGFWNKPGLDEDEDWIRGAATNRTVIACSDAGLLKFTRFHKGRHGPQPVEAHPA